MKIKKILIVDDSLITRLRLKKVLKEIDDFSITEADNGKKGLEILEEGQYDLMLLDLLMPNMTGFTVLEKIKEASINIPTIVVSADIQETTKKKCLDLGAINIVPKTATFNELKETILGFSN